MERKITYTLGATQAGHKVSLSTSGVDVQMDGIGDRPSRPSPGTFTRTVLFIAVPEVGQVQALVIHSVDSQRGFPLLLFLFFSMGQTYLPPFR